MKKLFLYFICFICISSYVLAEQVQILLDKDIDSYQHIFQLQKQEKWKQADQYISRLNNKLLMGHVLANRYLSKTWKTSKKEIENWFVKYADHPQAIRMYQLGKQKKAILPYKKPVPVYGGNAGTCSPVYRPEPIDSIKNLSFSYLKTQDRKKAKKLMNDIVRAIKDGRTLNAKNIIQSPQAAKLFSQRDHDAARIALAFSYFLDGLDNHANTIAQKAVERSGNQLPLGHWTLGLVAWRQGKIKQSAFHFDKIVKNEKAPAFLKSAAAYWASRANLKLGNFATVNSYLEIASQNSRTFYGILATRALGKDLNHTWTKPVLPEDEITESFSHPAFERVLALKQLGLEKQANEELTSLFFQADEQTKALLMVVAEKNGIEANLNAITGEMNTQEKVRYPAPTWTPTTGWELDKALIFSFVKQESCFNTFAKSNVGALGLMQLMPKNAHQIANRLDLEWDKKKLNDPEYNLALGQNYLLWLMKDSQIQNNLIYTAVAYNSGPGNLYKQMKKMRYHNDPLLFVESIPFKETRGFVERIMANYWIYQTLMNQDVSSLDNLIQGNWPLYVMQDK